ncbi:RHOMBOID-like protein 2 [Impatiens glandulifera]|uniref:RHOMBOID-like protein 2 n=1 Tax=Impatiens glandulifera TaxID=253017 RepID=UPI001FB10A8B|nr:RHOMBOID-like protein 2 [Impatiens glandulifera]
MGVLAGTMIVKANIAMFIVIMFINKCPSNNISKMNGTCVARFLGRISFQPLKENPLFGPSSSALEKLGGLEWSKIVNEHQQWKLISCVWLHAGLIHLFANMLSLVFIGIRLEQQFRFLRIGGIYLLSGFDGSILSSLFIQKNISVGASGALFGLLGAMLSELFTNWTISEGPLHGIPYGLKDTIAVPEYKTMWGSKPSKIKY